MAQVVELLDDLEDEVATGDYINSEGHPEVRALLVSHATACTLKTITSC